MGEGCRENSLSELESPIQSDHGFFLIINLKKIMLLKNEFAGVIELLIASTDSN